MRLSRILMGLVLLSPAVASAERALKVDGTAQLGELVGAPPDINGLVFARQVLPPSAGTPGTVVDPNGTVVPLLAQSKIIYLNKNGVTLTPGNNDSRTNRSSIASQTTAIPAWNTTPAVWTATVACMKDLFSAYDVSVVETDPGNVPHMEAVFGGSPTQLGMPNNVAGVSPFTTDCSIIENSIVFTFTAVLPNDARLACEIMAQEVAHSYGLDHELLAADPMTYLQYNGNRSFQNTLASCGEDVARPCGINGSTCRAKQSSVALLTERLGPKIGGGDVMPPMVGISSPSNLATVPPGFQVQATATDNITVSSAKLFVDGTQTDMQTTAGPYVFTTSASLSEGMHIIKIEATDGTNVQSSEITVTVKKGATPPGGTGGTGGGTDGDITGGCSTGRGGGLVLGLALVGLLRRRRT
jgi:hypothetical protein